MSVKGQWFDALFLRVCHFCHSEMILPSVVTLPLIVVGGLAIILSKDSPASRRACILKSAALGLVGALSPWLILPLYHSQIFSPSIVSASRSKCTTSKPAFRTFSMFSIVGQLIPSSRRDSFHDSARRPARTIQPYSVP